MAFAVNEELTPEEKEAYELLKIYKMIPGGIQALETAAGTVGGALIGSVLPVIGTAAGAAGGGAIGTGIGAAYAGLADHMLVRPTEKRANALTARREGPLRKIAARRRQLEKAFAGMGGAPL